MQVQYTDIFNNIAKHIQLTTEECRYFESLLSIRTIKSRQFLLKEGQFAKDIYYVLEGCLRHYSIDPNGVEHITSFGPKDWWITDIYSLISNKPSYTYIDAVMPTTFIELKRTDWEILYEKVPKFERFFRIMIEKSVVANQQRTIDFMSKSAEERYLQFVKRYPSLVNTIAQKQIAAYLGITPEFLSKMRSKLAREGKL
jgi:CRP-like cAMP-binding protein